MQFYTKFHILGQWRRMNNGGFYHFLVPLLVYKMDYVMIGVRRLHILMRYDSGISEFLLQV